MHKHKAKHGLNLKCGSNLTVHLLFISQFFLTDTQFLPPILMSSKEKEKQTNPLDTEAALLAHPLPDHHTHTHRPLAKHTEQTDY